MNDLTLNTYNKSAEKLASYFMGHGSRVDEIEIALKLANKTNKSADVLEIGCGDGRDAEEIVKRTKTYIGIDYSKELISIAKIKLPNTEFKIADMLDYNYVNKVFDVVFAFASILHLSKQDLIKLIPKLHQTLKEDGVLFLSLKYADEYKSEWQNDEFGSREFFYYNPKVIKEILGEYFEVVYLDRYTLGSKNKPWFKMALRKK